MHSNSVWQNGPQFLNEPFENWPLSQNCEVDLPDVIGDKLTCLLNLGTQRENYIIDIGRFSSYRKLLRVTARILSLKTYKTLKAISQSPSIQNINIAEEYLIKHEQSNCKLEGKV